MPHQLLRYPYGLVEKCQATLSLQKQRFEGGKKKKHVWEKGKKNNQKKKENPLFKGTRQTNQGQPLTAHGSHFKKKTNTEKKKKKEKKKKHDDFFTLNKAQYETNSQPNSSVMNLGILKSLLKDAQRWIVYKGLLNPTAVTSNY